MDRSTFSYVAPTWWNNLPNDVKNFQSLAEFKSKARTFLFNVSFFLFKF